MRAEYETIRDELRRNADRWERLSRGEEPDNSSWLRLAFAFGVLVALAAVGAIFAGAFAHG